MTTTLKAFKAYPWAKWTNGKIYHAKRGVDFKCSVAGFRSVLYSHASRHGMSVQVRAMGKFVDFQFSKK